MQFYNLFFTLVLGIVQFVCPQYLNRLSNTDSIISVIKNFFYNNYKQTTFYLRNYATKKRI